MQCLRVLQVHLRDLEPKGVVWRRTFDLRAPWQRAPWLHARTDKLEKKREATDCLLNEKKKETVKCSYQQQTPICNFESALKSLAKTF